MPRSYTQQEIEKAAEAAHENNRRYCESIGDTSQLPWADAPEWQRQSAINGVEFAIANDFPSPEAMHENWLKAKVADGWTYGETKDPIRRIHPCMRPYAELPDEQRVKDHLFRSAVMLSLGVDK